MSRAVIIVVPLGLVAALLAGCGSTAGPSSSTPAPVASASEDAGGVAAAPVACLPDCSKQDLRGVTFSRVNLDNAKFVDADLTGARFEDIKATGVSFAGAILANATFSLVDFSATDCTSGSYGEPKCESASDMRSRSYLNTTFDRSDFTGAAFKGSLMEGVTFRDSTFDYTDLSEAMMRDTSSGQGNILDGSRFRNAMLAATVIAYASLNGTDFTGAIFDYPKIITSKGTGTVFDKVTFYGTSIYDSTFTTPTFIDAKGNDGAVDDDGSTFIRANTTGLSSSGITQVGTWEDPICPDGVQASGKGQLLRLCPG